MSILYNLQILRLNRNIYIYIYVYMKATQFDRTIVDSRIYDFWSSTIGATKNEILQTSQAYKK